MYMVHYTLLTIIVFQSGFIVTPGLLTPKTLFTNVLIKVFYRNRQMVILVFHLFEIYNSLWVLYHFGKSTIAFLKTAMKCLLNIPHIYRLNESLSNVKNKFYI